jgi:hypothetical protein
MLVMKHIPVVTEVFAVIKIFVARKQGLAVHFVKNVVRTAVKYVLGHNLKKVGWAYVLIEQNPFTERMLRHTKIAVVREMKPWFRLLTESLL